MSSKNNNLQKKSQNIEEDSEIVWEFGGPLGALCIMLFSPLILYYFYVCLFFHDGTIIFPHSFGEIPSFFKDIYLHIVNDAYPTLYAVKIYVLFALFEAVIAAFLPGPHVNGLPVPSNGNKSLVYVCNGVICWYVTLIFAAILHFTRIFPITDIVDHFGPIMTVSIIVGNIVTVVTYVATIAFGKQTRMSGNHIYDIFMGAVLNPRIGSLDLKMWAEIRVPWVLLFFISVSAGVKQYETLGYLTPPLAFMICAHFLYANACQKGEECIPTTWDVFYEKWGYMLIFWNLSGVPFMYSYSSIYLLKHFPTITHSLPYTTLCFVLLFGGYYVWDTANSQKNRFRMQQRGTYIPRNTFPQLPWGTLVNPSYIKTKQGSLLLTGGWWGVARKIHYAADLVMALSWGLITGFSSFIPYWYFTFFVLVLSHRASRDMERCAKKYGKDWEAYCKTVPYLFIPGIY